MYNNEDDEKTIIDFYTNNNLIINEKKYYIGLLKIIRNENIKMKKVLELKYYYLSNYYNIIQCSVIFFSTLSAFIQALVNMNTHIKIPQNTVTLITLIISTFISLLLSIAKFFKISEKKESISNLLSDISQFNNKVIANIKKIKYWKINLIDNDNNNNENNSENTQLNTHELTQWISFSNKIKEDINAYFEQKLEIMNGYESLIDTYERTNYDIKNMEIKNKFVVKEFKINRKHNKLIFNLNNNNFWYKQCFRKLCLFFIYCFNCICCMYCKNININDNNETVVKKIDNNFNQGKLNIDNNLFKTKYTKKENNTNNINNGENNNCEYYNNEEINNIELSSSISGEALL